MIFWRVTFSIVFSIRCSRGSARVMATPARPARPRALTGLALAVRHPGRLRTLVAHEPPLIPVLPDAAAAADAGDPAECHRAATMAKAVVGRKPPNQPLPM